MKRLSLVAALLLLLTACFAETESDAGAQPEASPSDVSLEQSGSPPPSSDAAEIVEEVLPSVVNVKVTAVQSGVLGRQQAEGQGSGVIIDDAGIILTNNHVVQCAVEVEVLLESGEKTEGEVLGTAAEKDLAVIRIDGDDLEAVDLGDSSELRLGDGVVALGFPLGLGGPTVTQGIVSGTGRRIEPAGGVPLDGLLQTDAAINPGNSGGALVDMAGRLVGINTAAARAGAAENIGFAIPIDATIPVVEEILAGEEQSWLGVSITSVDSASVAAQLGVDPDVRGAAILELLEGPADEAGLEQGDIIVTIADRDVRSAEDLSEVLADFSPGDTVAVEVVSEDGTRTVDVELAERPSPEELNREIC